MLPGFQSQVALVVYSYSKSQAHYHFNVTRNLPLQQKHGANPTRNNAREETTLVATTPDRTKQLWSLNKATLSRCAEHIIQQQEVSNEQAALDASMQSLALLFLLEALHLPSKTDTYTWKTPSETSHWPAEMHGMHKIPLYAVAPAKIIQCLMGAMSPTFSHKPASQKGLKEPQKYDWQCHDNGTRQHMTAESSFTVGIPRLCIPASKQRSALVQSLVRKHPLYITHELQEHPCS